MISLKRFTTFSSGVCCSKIFTKICWLILAKNFLMSHFKTQQVLVLFFETMRANSLNLFIALRVPLFVLQENESEINILSKNGHNMRHTAWCNNLSLTIALWIVLVFGSFILKHWYPPRVYMRDFLNLCSIVKHYPSNKMKTPEHLFYSSFPW